MDATDTQSTAQPHVLDTSEAGGLALRGGALRVLSYVAGGVVALASAPLLIRHLGVEDFGRYATVIALIALAGGVTEGGLGPVGVREYSQREGAARDAFMRDLLGLRLTLALTGALGAVAFAALAGYDAEMVLGTAVAGVSLLVIVAQATYAIPLYAELRIGRQVALEFAAQVTSVALIVAFVLAGTGIVPFLAVPVVATGALMVATMAFVRALIPLRPAARVRRWLGVLRETLPVAVAVAVQTMYFRSVILIMSLIATEAQTGLFATSFRVTEVLLGIPALLLATLFPVLARAARDDRERLAYGLARILEVGLMAGIWMAACTALGAPAAMELLGGDEAEPAVDVLRVQAITLMLAFLSAGLALALLSLHRHAALMAGSGIALVVTVAATFALVPGEGAVGGAVAATIGEASLLLVVAVALHRAEPLSPLLPRSARKVLAAALVAAAAAVLPGFAAVPAVVVFTVVYGAVLLALGAVPPEIRHDLLGRIVPARR